MAYLCGWQGGLDFRDHHHSRDYSVPRIQHNHSSTIVMGHTLLKSQEAKPCSELTRHRLGIHPLVFECQAFEHQSQLLVPRELLGGAGSALPFLKLLGGTVTALPFLQPLAASVQWIKWYPASNSGKLFKAVIF